MLFCFELPFFMFSQRGSEYILRERGRGEDGTDPVCDFCFVLSFCTLCRPFPLLNNLTKRTSISITLSSGEESLRRSRDPMCGEAPGEGATRPRALGPSCASTRSAVLFSSDTESVSASSPAERVEGGLDRPDTPTTAELPPTALRTTASFAHPVAFPIREALLVRLARLRWVENLMMARPHSESVAGSTSWTRSEVDAGGALAYSFA